MMARGTDCAAHAHDARVPLERHHIRPLSRGGPDGRPNLVTLCANAHGDVHYLLTAIEKARGYGGVPEDVKRSFGYAVRRIALQGWQAYEADFLTGRLAREVQLWTTDGLPREPESAVPPYGHAVTTVVRFAEGGLITSDPRYLEWVRERARSLPSPSP